MVLRREGAQQIITNGQLYLCEVIGTTAVAAASWGEGRKNKVQQRDTPLLAT